MTWIGALPEGALARCRRMFHREDVPSRRCSALKRPSSEFPLKEKGLVRADEHLKSAV
jgi:hypothetical protein